MIMLQGLIEQPQNPRPEINPTTINLSATVFYGNNLCFPSDLKLSGQIGSRQLLSPMNLPSDPKP